MALFTKSKAAKHRDEGRTETQAARGGGETDVDVGSRPNIPCISLSMSRDDFFHLWLVV